MFWENFAKTKWNEKILPFSFCMKLTKTKPSQTKYLRLLNGHRCILFHCACDEWVRWYLKVYFVQLLQSFWECFICKSCLNLCYITDFLFAKKLRTPNFWIFNEHSVQVWEKIIIWFFFKFIYLFVFLENTCFVCNSMGNGPGEGAITSRLKHYKVYFSKHT